MDQIAARRGAAVQLGMPAFADTAGRTVTTLGAVTAEHQAR
jgi:hypothetical protein